MGGMGQLFRQGQFVVRCPVSCYWNSGPAFSGLSLLYHWYVHEPESGYVAVFFC